MGGWPWPGFGCAAVRGLGAAYLLRSRMTQSADWAEETANLCRMRRLIGRLGFEAAWEEAALLAELAGQAVLAAQLRAMRPLPDKGERKA